MTEPARKPALVGDTLNAEPDVRQEPRAAVAGPEELDRVLALWRSEMRHARSGRYLDQVEQIVRRLCVHAGATSIRGVKREHVVSLLDLWAVKGPDKRGTPLVGKSRLNVLSAIRGFWGWAVRIEEAVSNPGEDVTAPRVFERKERALTAAEIVAMIEYAGSVGAHDRALLYRTLAVTGLRIGEIAALRPSHFRVWGDDPHVYVPPELSEKGNREKSIAIDHETAEALRVYLAERDARGLAIPRPKHETLKRDMAGAGVSERDERGRSVAWHGFRRFTPSELARLKVNPAVAQQQLGHRRIATTLKHYTDVQLDQQRDAISLIADRLAHLKKKVQPGLTVGPIPETLTLRHGQFHTTSDSQTTLPAVPQYEGSQVAVRRAGQSGRGVQDSGSRSGTSAPETRESGSTPDTRASSGPDIPPALAGLLREVLGILSAVIGLVGSKGADREPADHTVRNNHTADRPS